MGSLGTEVRRTMTGYWVELAQNARILAFTGSSSAMRASPSSWPHPALQYPALLVAGIYAKILVKRRGLLLSLKPKGHSVILLRDAHWKELKAGLKQILAHTCSQQPKDGNNPSVLVHWRGYTKCGMYTWWNISQPWKEIKFWWTLKHYAE